MKQIRWYFSTALTLYNGIMCKLILRFPFGNFPDVIMIRICGSNRMLVSKEKHMLILGCHVIFIVLLCFFVYFTLLTYQ